jgi:hypothetical protein
MKTLKGITALFLILIWASCATNETIVEIEEIEEITPKNVEIILTTSQLEFDEITVSYYDFDLSEWVYGPMQFTYDADGNPEPIVISLPEYAYNTIEGEAYRKNNFESSLKVQVYVDEVLSFETESIGTDLEWAHVIFNFTIEE